MSVSEMVGSKREAFGIKNYSIPRPEPLVPLEKRKLPLGRTDKAKNLSFAEQVMKRK